MTRASTTPMGPYSASNVVVALADALGEIKRADHLTYADIGAVLGKSEDQAAKYADGSAVMDVITFGRGRREWGARFTGRFDLLCEAHRGRPGCDRHALTQIMQAVCEINRALEDGVLAPADVEAMQVDLLEARAAIDSLLGRIPLSGPQAPGAGIRPLGSASRDAARSRAGAPAGRSGGDQRGESN